MANFIFGPCPKSAQKGSTIASHSVYSDARHVFDRMPTRSSCMAAARPHPLPRALTSPCLNMERLNLSWPPSFTLHRPSSLSHSLCVPPWPPWASSELVGAAGVPVVPSPHTSHEHHHELRLYLLYLVLALAVSVRRRDRRSTTAAITVNARAWPGRLGPSPDLPRPPSSAHKLPHASPPLPRRRRRPDWPKQRAPTIPLFLIRDQGPWGPIRLNLRGFLHCHRLI